MTAPYYLAARYKSKTHSGNVTALVRAIVYIDKQSLSVYAVVAKNGFYIVVIGEEPPACTKQRLEKALVSGERVTLHFDDLDDLYTYHLSSHPYRR